jgi:hypothetical protein
MFRTHHKILQPSHVEKYQCKNARKRKKIELLQRHRGEEAGQHYEDAYWIKETSAKKVQEWN